jgi:hypothetical protein
VKAFTDLGDSGGTVYVPYISGYPYPTPRAVGTIFQRQQIGSIHYTWINTVNGMNAALGNKYYYAW